jgi:hypothetical protein
MISLMLLIGILGLLFLMPFAANRRFGVLGLALAAGSLLSTNWTGTLTPFIEQQGVIIVAPPLGIIVAAALIILPAAALLFSGPSYHAGWQRILGSFAFTILALAFLIDPFKLAFQFEGAGLALINTVDTYASIIIVAGIIAAIADILLTGRHKSKKEK